MGELGFLSVKKVETHFFSNLRFFNTLFGSLNHFGQNVLHSVPKKKRENKRDENYLSEMRYLNRLRLKQDSLVIEQKETGKPLSDLAMYV